jgi:Flp pilus assembly protein CpaB
LKSRSNRLILLVGVVLAAVAFVAIVFLVGNPSKQADAIPTTAATVIATVDIPLGTQVRSDMLTTKQEDLANRAADAIGDPSQVVGQIARSDIATNAQLTKAMFATNNTGAAPGPLLAKGFRAQAVQVDQVSGVGTLVNVGDRVDAVVGIGAQGLGDGGTTQCGAKFPALVVDTSGTTDTVAPLPDVGSTLSVKLLLQNMQVVSTLLPPIDTTTNPQASPGTVTGTNLNGQKEIVILAVTPQQSEVIKYAQVEGCISLVLRSPKDYVDDAGNAIEPALDPTTGIILKTLVDEYGVLPPQIVEAILPKK